MAAAEPTSRRGSAIVFDPATLTLTTEKVQRLESTHATKPKKAPKWANRVDIYDESESNRLVATLNLGKLSWSTNMKRLVGKCNQIYVMELPDEMPSRDIAAA
ncbi:hypothetical protein MMC28_002931 [Mycoblastus sanguinarius]|nr:hypothetical protein [Mycoblastus sanguinarius]